MVGVNESRNNYRSSTRLGYVKQEFFSDIAAKFFPLRIAVEDALVNVRTLRIVC
jgi:hypothetical protein